MLASMVVRVLAAASMAAAAQAAAIDRCDLKSISAYLCGPGAALRLALTMYGASVSTL